MLNRNNTNFKDKVVATRGIYLEDNHDLNLPGMPLELKLILHCLRASADQDVGDQIDSLSRRTIDWDNFIKLVDRHRVVSQAYKSLNQFAANYVPEPVHTRLRKRFHRNTQRVLIKTAELIRIVRRFEQSGSPILPLKGPVLALQLYGDLGLRHVGDLDIMVPPESVKEAENLLRQEGYRRTNPEFDLSPRQHAAYVRNYHHFGYHCEDRGILVELHWRFGTDHSLLPLKFREIWRARQTVRLGGTGVAALSLEHTILFLCTHGAFHNWFRLFWLNDMVRVLKEDQTIDWSALMMHAEQLGTRRMVAEGVVLANLLLGSPLPGQVLEYAEKDKGVYGLVKIAYHLIKYPGGASYRPFTPAFIRTVLSEFKLRKGLKFKLGCLLRQIGPAAGDWESISLPDALSPLYYFLRPFMWFFRWHVRGIKVYREGPMGREKNDTT